MSRNLALLLTFCIAGNALADAPLPPPQRLTVCSPAGLYCAVSDPAKKLTLVARKGSDESLWTIPGWHRWLFVSDDGESVVVGYSGMNLVPVDVSLGEPVLLFYKRGKLVRTITLGDLYRHKSQLTPTASHLAWARSSGFNRAGQLVVELVDGRRLAFAATTGQREAPVPD